MSDVLDREAAEERRFRAALKASWKPVYKVAIHLHQRGGRIVQLNPLIIRPSREARAGYGDDYDLRVFKLGDLKWVRLEVKGKKFDFTCAADFPYATIYLDRPEKADKCGVDGFYIVSKDGRYAAVIHASTREHWKPVTAHDGDKGYDFTAYECPKEFATFINIAVEEAMQFAREVLN